jgi:peptidoglycan hydrolase CwlO-like protein
MLRRNAVWLVAIVTIVAGAWIQQAIAEEGPPTPRDQRDQRDPAQMQQRMEQFRADRMKQALGASDDEWKVLQPRIEKVQTLSRQTRGGGMGFMMGGRGGPQRGGPGDRPQSDRPQSEVEKKSEALQKVLDNKEAKVEEIKTALTALREARAKARAELETAQKELREVITVRQEAQLVTLALLD